MSGEEALSLGRPPQSRCHANRLLSHTLPPLRHRTSSGRFERNPRYSTRPSAAQALAQAPGSHRLRITIWQRDVSRAGLQKPFVPDEDDVQLLNKLAQDPWNQVWLMSGLLVKGAMEKIAETVPKIGIVERVLLEDHLISQVRPPCRSTWLFMLILPSSSRSGRLALLLRNAKLLSSGVSGPDPSSTAPTVSRPSAKPRRRKTTSLTVLASGTGCELYPGATASSFSRITSRVRRLSGPSCSPAHAPSSGRAAWMRTDITDADSVMGDIGFVLAVSGDEKLLRRLNEIDQKRHARRATLIQMPSGS